MGMSSWSRNLKDRDEQEMVAKKNLFMKKYAVRDTLQKAAAREERKQGRSKETIEAAQRALLIALI